jgi:DNA-binding CsgD family transcriptional regulator
MPYEERHQRSAIDAARATLGADTFDRAWAEGSALALEEATDYARRGRGARKRPKSGWSSLTPAELKVADLVAEGLTNREIGARLFISDKTVRSHLTHVFAKLGVATRAQLASEVTRRRTS